MADAGRQGYIWWATHESSAPQRPAPNVPLPRTMTTRPLRNALLRLLSRPASGRRFIPELDGLRFVGLLPVVLTHLNEYYLVRSGREGRTDFLSTVLAQGSVGLPLFFVLSGFIISLPFAQRIRRGEPGLLLRPYFLRRLTRLEPPYVLNLLLLYALMVSSGRPARELGAHLLASVLYLHNLVYGSMSAINGVAWSLEIEFQFYLLAPLLVAVFRIRGRFPRRAVLVAMTCAAACVSAAGVGYPRVRLSILGYAHFFFAGLLLTEIYLVRWEERPRRDRWGDLLGVASIAAVLVILFGFDHPPRVFLPLPLLGICCAAFRGSAFNRFLRHPAVYLAGGMCYTVYLYHYYVISALGGAALRLTRANWPVWADLLIMAGVLLPAVFLASTVLFVAIERPFMSRRPRTSPSPGERPAAAVETIPEVPA